MFNIFILIKRCIALYLTIVRLHRLVTVGERREIKAGRVRRAFFSPTVALLGGLIVELVPRSFYILNSIQKLK